MTTSQEVIQIIRKEEMFLILSIFTTTENTKHHALYKLYNYKNSKP